MAHECSRYLKILMTSRYHKISPYISIYLQWVWKPWLLQLQVMTCFLYRTHISILYPIPWIPGRLYSSEVSVAGVLQSKKQQPFDSKIFWRKSQVSITGPSNSVPDLGSHEVPATCWGGMSFRSSHLVEFTYVHLILNGKLQIRLPNLVWMCFCMSLHCDNTYGHMVMNMAGEYSNKTLLSCFGTLRSPYSWTCSA